MTQDLPTGTDSTGGAGSMRAVVDLADLIRYDS